MNLEEKIFTLENLENLDLRKVRRVDSNNGKMAMIHRGAIEKEILERVEKIKI